MRGPNEDFDLTVLGNSWQWHFPCCAVFIVLTRFHILALSFKFAFHLSKSTSIFSCQRQRNSCHTSRRLPFAPDAARDLQMRPVSSSIWISLCLFVAHSSMTSLNPLFCSPFHFRRSNHPNHPVKFTTPVNRLLCRWTLITHHMKTRWTLTIYPVPVQLSDPGETGEVWRSDMKQS